MQLRQITGMKIIDEEKKKKKKASAGLCKLDFGSCHLLWSTIDFIHCILNWLPYMECRSNSRMDISSLFWFKFTAAPQLKNVQIKMFWKKTIDSVGQCGSNLLQWAEIISGKRASLFSISHKHVTDAVYLLEICGRFKPLICRRKPKKNNNNFPRWRAFKVRRCMQEIASFVMWVNCIDL